MPSDSGFSKEVKSAENESGFVSSASQTAKTSSPSVAGNSRSLQDGPTSTNVQNKRMPVLTPAPLPTRSPWKSMATDIPVSKIPVEALEGSKRNRPKATNSNTVKSSSSTKWVPIKASIVVSGSKRTGNGKKGSNRQSQGPTGSNNNMSNANNNNGRSSTANGKKKKQQQLQQVSAKSRQQQPPLESGIARSGDTSPCSDSISITMHNDKTSKLTNKDEDSDFKDSFAIGQQQSQSKDRFNKHNENVDHLQRKQHYFNNQHHSRNQQVFPRRKYFNNGYHLNANSESYRNSHGFQQHHPKSNFIPHHGGSGRSFNTHYRGPRYPGSMHQQLVPPVYQQQFHPMQAILIAVNSVARQLEYYFSTENLEKDEYLRSKLSDGGYAPITLISKFYRVNNMSFGGDPYLILASLREIVANEQSTVDIAIGSLTKSNFELDAQDEESPLAKYFIRSKEWCDLLPENVSTEIKIEKNLEGNEMDEFLIAPLPTPPVYGPSPGPGPGPGPAPGPASAPAPPSVSVAVPVTVPAPVPPTASTPQEDERHGSENKN